MKIDFNQKVINPSTKEVMTDRDGDEQTYALIIASLLENAAVDAEGKALPIKRVQKYYNFSVQLRQGGVIETDDEGAKDLEKFIEYQVLSSFMKAAIGDTLDVSVIKAKKK